MVEQQAVNLLAAGSSPASSAMKCNKEPAAAVGWCSCCGGNITYDGVYNHLLRCLYCAYHCNENEEIDGTQPS